jgi:acyl-CoA thioesterase FadM
MARIEITIPDHIIFKTTLPVTITDINYGKHLGNDKVLGFMHEARVQFFEWLGFSEADIDGVSVIQADTAVVYKSEAFHRDVIEVQLSIGEFSRAGFELYYRLYNITQQKDCAWAKTGMVCFDYTERKVKSVPDVFRQRCEKLIQP